MNLFAWIKAQFAGKKEAKNTVDITIWKCKTGDYIELTDKLKRTEWGQMLKRSLIKGREHLCPLSEETALEWIKFNGYKYEVKEL